MHQSESSKRIIEVEDNRKKSHRPSLLAISLFINILIGFLVLLLVVGILCRVERLKNYEEIEKPPYVELKWMTPEDIENYETFLFDVDGTLKNYSGYFPEAMEFLDQLKRKNKTVIIVSNDDTVSPEEKASRFGLSPSNIVTPLAVMKAYAVEKLKGRRILAFAPSLVKNWLKQINSTVVNNEFIRRKGEYTNPDEILATVEHPEIIIMDSFPDYNFEVIDRIINILDRSEAKLYLLPADPVLRTKHNLLWSEVAVIYEAVKFATGKSAEIFGKPSENWNRFLRDHFNLEKAIIFGDSLYADMRMANQLAIDSCFMSLTGMNNENDWRKFYREGKLDRKPTYKGSFVHLIKESNLGDP